MMVGVAMISWIASEKGGHIVAATIIVCSNDIPRAGIMDASHQYCSGCNKGSIVLSSNK